MHQERDSSREMHLLMRIRGSLTLEGDASGQGRYIKRDASRNIRGERRIKRDDAKNRLLASWCERYIKRDASREMHQERYIL